jgi:uncharacterized membrane protein YkvA (DUF1232 family)
MNVLDRAKMALAFLSDPRVGKLPRLAVLAAVAYLISPVDLVPEMVVPVAGFIDDAILVWMSFRWLFIRGEQARKAEGPLPTAKRVDR